MFGQYKGLSIKIIATSSGFAYIVNGEKSIVSCFSDAQSAWPNAHEAAEYARQRGYDFETALNVKY